MNAKGEAKMKPYTEKLSGDCPTLWIALTIAMGIYDVDIALLVIWFT